MSVSNLESSCLDDERRPTKEFRSAVNNVFKMCCSDGKDVMDRADVDRWLEKINKRKDRGSEFHFIKRHFDEEGNDFLDEAQFFNIHHNAVKVGSFWEAEYNLQTFGQGLQGLKKAH